MLSATAKKQPRPKMRKVWKGRYQGKPDRRTKGSRRFEERLAALLEKLGPDADEELARRYVNIGLECERMEEARAREEEIDPMTYAVMTGHQLRVRSALGLGEIKPPPKANPYQITLEDIEDDADRERVAEILGRHERAGPGGGRHDPHDIIVLLNLSDAELADLERIIGGVPGLNVEFVAPEARPALPAPADEKPRPADPERQRRRFLKTYARQVEADPDGLARRRERLAREQRLRMIPDAEWIEPEPEAAPEPEPEPAAPEPEILPPAPRPRMVALEPARHRDNVLTLKTPWPKWGEWQDLD